ncbi:stage II sporulation protein M [Exiguobacterium sp. SH1S4]|nr:stage II sporulation protein M [Exiguobacterium sp. SH4S7]TCI44260.1 stage II sporulation protein M [Exiguobacterium sp. SH5S32]TCI50525.1 stage II sporulation protein M [Exiguobacterium sp. SH1S4]TCI69484.1 stage II sporulation protein M [Exiguobacterium sp. SH1S1]
MDKGESFMKTSLSIREAWNDYYRKDFVRLLLVFFVTVVVSYWLFRTFVAAEQVDEILAQLGESFEASGLTFDSSARDTMIALFVNNTRVTLLAFLLGMIPLFIPYVFVVINAAVIGLVAMLVGFTGESVIKVLVLGILPHGVTEISAILLGAAMGLSLNRHVWKKLRGKETDVTFKALLLAGIKTFLFIAVPLLAVSAVIEAYVTPLLLQ